MLKSEKLADKIIEGLQNSKGHRIIKIDLRKIENCFCSFFVICHGTSNTHVAALSETVYEKVKKDLNEQPYHCEGKASAQWIVMDYGDVVIHIFQKEQRDFYQLEEFWADAKITNIEEN